MPKPLIKARGEKLGIPEAGRKLIAEYAILFLLRDDYLRSARPPLLPSGRQTFVAFGSPKLRSASRGDVVVIPSAQNEATQSGDGFVTIANGSTTAVKLGTVSSREVGQPGFQDCPEACRTVRRTLELPRDALG